MIRGVTVSRKDLRGSGPWPVVSDQRGRKSTAEALLRDGAASEGEPFANALRAPRGASGERGTESTAEALRARRSAEGAGRKKMQAARSLSTNTNHAAGLEGAEGDASIREEGRQVFDLIRASSEDEDRYPTIGEVLLVFNAWSAVTRASNCASASDSSAPFDFPDHPISWTVRHWCSPSRRLMARGRHSSMRSLMRFQRTTSGIMGSER